jgi:hypothetical protein
MNNKKQVSKETRILLVVFLVLALGILIVGCSSGSTEVGSSIQTVDNQSKNSLVDRPAVTEDTKEQQPVKQIDLLALPAGNIVSADFVDQANLDNYFVAYDIPDTVFERINGKSYRDNPNIFLDELRYLKVLHYNFDHDIQVGELIVNASLASDFTDIFKELFSKEYEIESMFLVDNYWTGDGTSSDSASIAQNNTSAFCYRAITGGSGLSNHAYGKAIDINPRQNPYFEFYNGSASWGDSGADAFLDRSSGAAHMITHDDPCFLAFQKHGFTWGGDWSNPIDYQHFEKQD